MTADEFQQELDCFADCVDSIEEADQLGARGIHNLVICSLKMRAVMDCYTTGQIENALRQDYEQATEFYWGEGYYNKLEPWLLTH